MLSRLTSVTVLLAALVLSSMAAHAQAADRRIVFQGDASPVAGQHRLALVIGNTNYPGANQLTNPVHDATAIAQTLKTLGFTTTLLLDATRIGIRDAVDGFAGDIAAAGPGTVALLYYSGHGMQVNGENYLVPVDFPDSLNERDLDYYAYGVETAVDAMRDANAQVDVLILDACRTNPFKRQGDHKALGEKGLAPLQTQGVYVSYAAGPGQTASDNTLGANGLYTQELLKNLAQPGWNIDQVFKQTKQSVWQLSGGQQTPYIEDGLFKDDFYFDGKDQPGPAPVPPIITPVVTTATVTVSCNTPGATITVDGQAASADAPLTVDCGTAQSKTVTVYVSAPRYITQAKRVTLSPGDSPTVPFSLDPEPAPPVPAPLGPGATRVNPKDGAEMVYVPAGAFTMGAAEFYNAPTHTVNLSGYWIYKNDVTVAEYKAFCQATGRAMPQAPSWGWQDDNPVVDVTWDDATAYAAWAGVSLPTEAQWEKAARGTDGRAYPWGNDWDPSLCVHSASTFGDLGSTKPVGSCPAGASPYGCLDMAGNVCQWCADWYDENYYKSSPASDPAGPESGTIRVLRGGSWCIYGPGIFRAAGRSRYDPTGSYYDVGFRCSSRLD